MFRSWKEFKPVWLAALRSGQYKQTTGRLCEPGKKHDTFCCLGVAANILIENGHDLKWVEPSDDSFEYDLVNRKGKGDNGQLSPIGPKWLAKVLQTHLTKPGMYSRVESELIDLNDSGYSFKKIAKWIEKNL